MKKKNEKLVCADNSVLNLGGLNYKFDLEGNILLNLKDVAVGLGFEITQIQNEKEYKKIRWSRVEKYLKQFGFVPQVVQCSYTDTYIPEPMFYLLAMKADSATAREFQIKVATKILPSIRKNGGYISDNATPEQTKWLAENQLLDYIKDHPKRYGDRLSNLIESKDCHPILCKDSYSYIYERLSSKQRSDFNHRFKYSFNECLNRLKMLTDKESMAKFDTAFVHKNDLLVFVEREHHKHDNKKNGQILRHVKNYR